MDIKNLIEDMENWILNYLDVPSEHYNDLKPCPFAKKAWLNDEVKVVLGEEEEVLYEIDNWDDQHSLIAVVFEDWEGAENWSEELNKTLCKKDLYLMTYEPSEQEEEGDPALDAIEWQVDEFGWVFIQRLSEVCKYSNLLQTQGYYKDTSVDFINYKNQRSLHWFAPGIARCRCRDRR